MFISFLPIGNIGLKYLENNYIYKKHYKNIDNIIVLSGSNYRLIESVKLGNKFKNAKVYYIGGNAYLIKKKINDEVSKAKKIYEDLNFDMTRVKFVGQSRNTIENFKEIKELNLKYSETILITSAYHMKRSMMIAEKQGVKVLPYPVNPIKRSKTPLLNSYQVFDLSNNLSKFNTFFREILGIIAFKISSYT